MPKFSDLPNELVAITWGFVDEPEDIESFALVSKTVYNLSKPFVQEHARLKHLPSTIFIDVQQDPNGPYDLLEQLLDNPRLAFYIDEALIEDWTTPGDRQYVSLTSMSPQRIAKFESAVNCSSYVPPAEKELWVRKVKNGNPDPIVALIIMRLTKLRYLRLVFPFRGGNFYLLGTLKRMILSPDGASDSGPSVTQIGPHGGSPVIFKKPWPFRHVNDIGMDFGLIKPIMLAKLLRGLKELESFAFASTFDTTFNFRQLHGELLKSCRGSLKKLNLHDASQCHCYMGRFTGFWNLKELKISVNLLLGYESEQRRRLVYALPASVESLSLFLGSEAEPDEVEDMVDQVIEAKLKRCIWLDTFWVETVDLVEMDDEDESQLKEKLAEVGVEFEMGEYSNL